MREIKFRAFNGGRIVKVDTIWWADGEINWVDTPKNYDFSEDFILMQYTGLKDKYGVEIYEGDIVKLTVPTYKTSTKVIHTLYDAFVLESNVESNDYIEILGNIHNNPELLED